MWLFSSTDFADYTDYSKWALEIAKSAGFNPPQLAAGKFISKIKSGSFGPDQSL
jgi:hypothetical protein